MTLKLAACARWPQILAGPSLEALVLQVMRATTWCCFKEALFKGGKKLSDADVCETLKTVTNTLKTAGRTNEDGFRCRAASLTSAAEVTVTRCAARTQLTPVLPALLARLMVLRERRLLVGICLGHCWSLQVNLQNEVHHQTDKCPANNRRMNVPLNLDTH